MTRSISFRFTDPVMADLEYLADCKRQTKTEVLSELVISAADTLRGNPRAQELLAKLSAVQSELEAITASVK